MTGKSTKIHRNIDLTDPWVFVEDAAGFFAPVWWPVCKEPGCENRRLRKLTDDLTNPDMLMDYCYLHSAQMEST